MAHAARDRLSRRDGGAERSRRDGRSPVRHPRCARRCPDDWRARWTLIADGIGDARRRRGHRASSVATSPAPRSLCLTTTVLGAGVRAAHARWRLRPGDTVYVTGRLGGPGARRQLLEQRRTPARAHRERFAHPSRECARRSGSRTHGATAAIDISDGLARRSRALAPRSDVGIDVDLALVPLLARRGSTAAPPRRAAKSTSSSSRCASVVRHARRSSGRFGIPLTAHRPAAPAVERGCSLRHGASALRSLRGTITFLGDADSSSSLSTRLVMTALARADGHHRAPAPA